MAGAPTHRGSRLPVRACVHTRLEVFLPVMVDAMTTSTAATRTATIQRTQSTPRVSPAAAERGVHEPAEDDSADAAQDGEPDRDVVLVAGSDELAQQADDDASDDDADDFHVRLSCSSWTLSARR